MSDNQTKDLAVVEHQPFNPLAIDEMVGKINYLEQFKQKVLKQDSDYGIIPGTKKPTLYKAGAEKLAFAFNLNASYEIVSKIEEPFREWEFDSSNGKKKARGYFKYTILCKVYNKTTGEFWSSQLADCDSLERGRELSPSNTIMKMAEKRAYVGAVLNATYTSDRFTQDVEDYRGEQSPSSNNGANPYSNADGFPSKFGTEAKPNKCCFCGKNHVVKGMMITRGDGDKEYGSVECFASNGGGSNVPPTKDEEQKADSRVDKFMELTLEELKEITANTENDAFGDPNNDAVKKDIMAFRYKAVNEKILGLPNIEKNNKGQLARYILYICDSYGPKE